MFLVAEIAAGLALGLGSGPAWAEEIEIVTYYPAPASTGGDFDRLHANRATIGDAYNRTNVPDTQVPDGHLLVSERIGIGVTDPQEQLELTGNIRLPHTDFISGQPSTVGILYKDADVFLHDRGVRNLFLGTQAGNLTTSGVDNVAIGHQALQANAGGTGNVAVGSSALTANLGGGNNVAIGERALPANTGGASNIAIGVRALEQNTSGAGNVAIGHQALTSVTTQGRNVAVGQGAIGGVEGSENVALGWQAGNRSPASAGNSNIYIGSQAGSGATGSNKLYIDNSNTANPLIYGDFASDLVGIGTSAPQNPAPNNQPGNLDVNDIWLRSVNQWVSTIAAAGGGYDGVTVGTVTVNAASSGTGNHSLSAFPGATRVLFTVTPHQSGDPSCDLEFRDSAGNVLFTITDSYEPKNKFTHLLEIPRRAASIRTTFKNLGYTLRYLR